ncbi:hypothetical protein BWQ96_10413 [Gracilariopsis chorda]|uniref:Uncharacterized protein n=1 Tax=Gracilariopsis chorda TaxID=448386 RepID=A0A2V3ICS4_9FLOR|nr:hypothetical protein BWQ96_10413 [Gracilariopsis chorda]|eukprot:PXF39877.1 hypothetical protein BWQ96_10413 [Gracilariopsis chorda]
MEVGIKCYGIAPDVKMKNAAQLDWASFQMKFGVSFMCGCSNLAIDVEGETLCLLNVPRVLPKEAKPLLFVKVNISMCRVLAGEWFPYQTTSAALDTLNGLEYVKLLAAAVLLHARSLDEDYDALLGILATS